MNKIVGDGQGGLTIRQQGSSMLDAAEAANLQQLLTNAVQAFQNNKDYLALGTPTAAQVAQQVAALTRQANGLLRLMFHLYDSTT